MVIVIILTHALDLGKVEVGKAGGEGGVRKGLEGDGFAGHCSQVRMDCAAWFLIQFLSLLGGDAGISLFPR